MDTNTALIYREYPSGVAEISLNRPETRNAFDDRLINDLIVAFNKAESSSTVNVVLLSSVGKHFSAGADLNWMRGMAKATYQQNLDDAKKLATLMRTIKEIEKPVVAKVQGAAFGGAIGLIACADIAVADEQSTFALSEVKLGLCPATISPYVIEAIGQRSATKLFLTGETFDAERAHQIGLISELSNTNNLDNTVNNILSALMKNGPKALIKTKQLIRKVTTEKSQQAIFDYTCEVIAELRVSEEGQEGLTAFLEKRPPSWISQNREKD